MYWSQCPDGHLLFLTDRMLVKTVWLNESQCPDGHLLFLT